MRLVEIAGHNIDPRMVADVGPIRPIGTNGIDAWGFDVCANGVVMWDFYFKEGAEKIRRSLLEAIESAQPEKTELEKEWHPAWLSLPECDWPIGYGRDSNGKLCCVSWLEHDPYDKLTKAIDAEVVEAKAELDEWHARKHPCDSGVDLLGASDAPDGIDAEVGDWGRSTDPLTGLVISASRARVMRDNLGLNAKVQGWDPKPSDALAEVDALAEAQRADALAAGIQWPKEMTGLEASDALVGVEGDEQMPLSCPADCADGIPELACCRLCAITGTRAGRIAPAPGSTRQGTKICPDLELPSSYGFKAAKG